MSTGTSNGSDVIRRLRMLRPGLIPEGIWNAVLDVIGRCILLPGPGYRIKPAGIIGYTLELLHPPTQAASSSPPFPFKCLSFVPVGGDMTGASGYYATFFPGLVNGYLYPTVGGTPMWQLVPVTVAGVTSYVRPTLLVNKGDTIFVNAVVTMGTITSLSLLSGTFPTETDSLTGYEVGTCDPATGAFTQVLRSSLGYSAAAAFFSSSGRLITHVWTEENP